jgi:hypothetical protein
LTSDGDRQFWYLEIGAIVTNKEKCGGGLGTTSAKAGKKLEKNLEKYIENA